MTLTLWREALTRSVSWFVTNTFATEPSTQPREMISMSSSARGKETAVPRLSKLCRFEMVPPRKESLSIVV